MDTASRRPSGPRLPRIVIVGAGFGGLSAAKALAHAAVDVVLIDRANHHLFQPLLYQVATAALSPADIATATRALLRRQGNVTVIMADATGVDTAARTIALADGRRLDYDGLVLATGAAYSFFGQDQWAQDTLVLKSVDDAVAIRDRLLLAFELAESLADPDDVKRLLTFVVVGGGATGVELAGTIAELARATLARDFRRIDPAAARVLLYEAGPRLLAAFPERLAAYALRALQGLGVVVNTGTKVDGIDARGLTAGGDRVESATILWCAGTQARPAAQWLGAEAAHNGAVKVDAHCAVPHCDGVYAIGDVASQAGADGKPLPGLAAVAKQQGAYVGRLLARKYAGQPAPAAFKYRNLGTMAVIGRSRAVADFGWLRLTGWLAWLSWSMVHLLLLVDARSRITVYINWVWSWLTYGRGARLITGPDSVAALHRPAPAAAVAMPANPVRSP